jgi:hypothetical protein
VATRPRPAADQRFPAHDGHRRAVQTKKQLPTHLRLAGKCLGLLVNFNVALIKEGITRIANGMPD